MTYLYIYILGAILTTLICRFVPGFNDLIHKSISDTNPTVAFIIFWPMGWFVLAIIYGVKIILSSINWAAGNGFVPKTQNVTGSTMGCNHKVTDLRHKDTK
jgi:hypothetical protein